MGNSMGDQSRRRQAADLDGKIEEGELVAGYHDDSGSETDDDSRYVFQRRDDVDDGSEGSRPEIKRRRLEGREGGVLPSPTSSSGSGFTCPACGRVFGSSKAVHGHMRVHGAPHGRQEMEKEKERPAITLAGGWGLTGKRRWHARRSVTREAEAEEMDNSMAIVVAEPRLPVAVAQPQPIAFAPRTNLTNQGNSSAQPSLSDSMAIVAVPSSQPNQIAAHQADAAAPPQAVVNKPAAPPAAAAPTELQFMALHGGEQGQAVRVFACKENGCNRTFDTHQGLGGHVAGHINKQKQAAAAAAAAGVGLGGAGAAGGAKPEAQHVCMECDKAFDSGVALGGHMRKHYKGKLVVHKRKRDTALSPADVLATTLSLALPVAQSAPAAAAAGTLRIFGVDILPKAEPVL